MILTGPAIKNARTAGEILIEPFSNEQLNPNSYNVRLGPRLAVYLPSPGVFYPEDITAQTQFPATILDCRVANYLFSFPIPNEGMVLYPGKLYLGSTLETTHTDKYVPMIEGRSSLARLGLSIHQTGGFGDQGFNGSWTLELACIEPIRIYAGIKIGQIQFWESRGEAQLYRGKYYHQTGPTPSQLHKELQGDL